jgi:hypothetical protein
LNYGPAAAGYGSLFINTTQVDMFGLPMTLQVQWPGNSQTVGIPDGQRAAIFAALRAANLGSLIVNNGTIDLRAMAINHGIDGGLIPANYLDAYIDAVWAYYTSNTLTYNQTTTAQVVNNQLVFSGAISTSVALPTSSEAIGGVNAIGSVAPYLTAGFNRGTLIPASGVNFAAQQPDADPADFYQVSPTNLYSKIIHQHSLNNLAYGFSYDDFFGFSSTIAPPTTPTSITATLSAF